MPLEVPVVPPLYKITALSFPFKNAFVSLGYLGNSVTRNRLYDELKNNDNTPANITDYHKLYRYPHQCSRIINKTIVSDKKLFISGDS